MVLQQGGVQYVQTALPQPAPGGQQIIIQGGPPVVGGTQLVAGPPAVIQGAPGAPQAVLIDQCAPGGPVVPFIQDVVPQQQQQQPADKKIKHIPLAKARVLYLGSAVPTETAVGLEALQQPLKERYQTGIGEVSGIDAWLTVFSSGLQMKYITKDNTEPSTVWFPIQTLHVCAAVKAIDLTFADNERQTKFVALDSEYGRKSTHPPIFSCIMRRTTGRKILEAHVFIAKSNQAAMALVQSATHAYEHKEGWTDDEPQDQAPANGGNDMRLLAADPPQKKCPPPEFYKAPPKQGYYYTPNKDLVKSYNVHGSSPMPVSGGMAMMPALPAPGDGYMMDYGMADPYIAEQGPYMDYAPPMEYFNDWGAFNSPVSILEPPPEEYNYPPAARDKKKKKKKHKHHHHHHDDHDFERDPIFNRYEYYPDNFYQEARKRDVKDRRPYKVEYFDDEPPRRREASPRRDCGGHKHRRKRDYHRDDLMFYAPAYLDGGDEFYDGYGGMQGGYGGMQGGYGGMQGGYGGFPGGYQMQGGGGYGQVDDLAQQFARPMIY